MRSGPASRGWRWASPRPGSRWSAGTRDRPTGPRGRAEAGIRLEPSKSGEYDGWFGVGTITASPPAGLAAMASGIDAKIAAALASPRAVHAKARRAYAGKRYGECADLLAQVTEPGAAIAYDHACCLALAGRKDDAFVKLHYAIGAGFQDLARSHR